MSDTDRDADVLRATISELLGRDAHRAILAPGALVALRLLFHHEGVSSVLLSDREYYAAAHFPDLEVHVAPFDDLGSAVERFSPGAVVASLVSWRGEVGAVDALCGSLRALTPGDGERDLRTGGGAVGARDSGAPPGGSPGGRERPLVCLDWCHAGAVGFPPADGLDADLVFGDVSKWLVPALTPDRVAFLLAREDTEPALRSCFGGLYRSGGGRTAREARWIDDARLKEVADRVRGAASDRNRLHARHQGNMELARIVARANGHPEPEAAILWFPDTSPEELDLSALPSPDLAWETDAGVRVLCQAAPT